MDYKITKMFGFKVIGFAKEFSFDTAYEEIPKYWDEICENMRLMYMQVIHLQIHMKGIRGKLYRRIWHLY